MRLGGAWELGKKCPLELGSFKHMSSGSNYVMNGHSPSSRPRLTISLYCSTFGSYLAEAEVLLPPHSCFEYFKFLLSQPINATCNTSDEFMNLPEGSPLGSHNVTPNLHVTQ